MRPIFGHLLLAFLLTPCCTCHMSLCFLCSFCLFSLRKIIKGINNRIENIVDLGEFLRWLGIMLLLATLNGFKFKDYWSGKHVDRK